MKQTLKQAKTPRQAILPLVALVASLVLPVAAPAQVQDPAADSTFAQIMQHYEAVRQALLSDGLDGVSDNGHKIHGIVEHLRGHWNVEHAGVSAEKADEAKALLPALSTAASQLAKADGLAAGREAFYSLSKALVRYRKLATGDLPAVAYCSMAKKSWLQPGEDIGNPYYGQEMLGCGEIVTPGGSPGGGQAGNTK